ncbi:DNA-(apurinic or apyrimidinic site) lyase 2-like [Dendronephthya gigantea]|uniref:DNA-(apurinic or apyrimidinic site) lyase 2-like n=1 Tax=Dendronephthya gigantea TaxID=151771 RepID=UPI00106D956C|nr:DNA-(apurinic or apyrimidinic site) lyase 2-like [Dendronephthya gigantea]
MKILTWNINGIRSVKKEQTLKELFDSLDVDVICLQETKITREMLEEETAIVEGYNAYFSFSKVRSGYSGVATFCRNIVTPVKAEDKIHLPEKSSDPNLVQNENVFTHEELESLNAEGRTILTEHLDGEGRHVVIMNLYCPRADLDNKERIEFKLKFYTLVEEKCKSLIQENKHVITLGDFNVSHKLIDHCDPNDPEIFDSNPSRQWANSFIWVGQCSEMKEKLKSNDTAAQNAKFIDTFRYFHPNQESAFTCWSTKTGARQTNYGTRIDYIFSSSAFFNREFVDCIIRPDIEGSDHCPVVASLKNTFQNSGKPPPLCTKYMPEFSRKQQKLKDFFKKKDECSNTSNIKARNREIPVKSSEKRSADSSLKSQAKRVKTNGSTSQGKISQFFKKKTEIYAETSNWESGKDVSDRSVNANAEKPKTSLEWNTSNIEQWQCSSQHSMTNSSQSSTSTSSELDSSNTPTFPNLNPTPPQDETQEVSNSAAVVSSWKNILKGLPPPPLCSGHKEPCVLRTVKNKGTNHGKRFYCCARPQGHATNKEARCNFFKWLKK